MADHTLNALIAQHFFGQTVTWLRQPGAERPDPWLIEESTHIVDDAKDASAGDDRPWHTGVTTDGWLVCWRGGQIVPNYSGDPTLALQVIQCIADADEATQDRFIEHLLKLAIDSDTARRHQMRGIDSADILKLMIAKPHDVCLAATRACWLPG